MIFLHAAVCFDKVCAKNMVALQIVASIFVFVTIAGSIVALATNQWVSLDGDASGLVFMCTGSTCLNELPSQPAFVKATFALLIISSFCSLMTFILLMIICRKKKSSLALAARIFAGFATLTLLTGCVLWTGFKLYQPQGTIQIAIIKGVIPFGYSFFAAWVSWVFSVVAFTVIICFRRHFAEHPVTLVSTSMQPYVIQNHMMEAAAVHKTPYATAVHEELHKRFT